MRSHEPIPSPSLIGDRVPLHGPSLGEYSWRELTIMGVSNPKNCVL